MTIYLPNHPAPDLTEVFDSPDGHDLIADTYLPPRGTGHGAAVLCVHGGGWSGGSRHQFRWHAHRLAQQGYVATTIDYRLVPTASYPGLIADCQAGVRYLRGQAQRLHLDPQRLGALGSSAGGHLVACLGVHDDPAHPVSSKVNAIVDVHGVHDFIVMAEEADEIRQNRLDLLGGPLVANRDTWAAASPALHVTADTPPMLLIHDPDDPTVPYHQSTLLVDTLMAHHRPVTFLPTPGSGHGFIYNPQNPHTQTTWPHIQAWLDLHLT